MEVFTVTSKEAEALRNFFSEEALNNIDKDGYYTLGVYDDEYFIAGVLQFFIGSSQMSGSYGLINYIYVQEDFMDLDAAEVLVDEFYRILSSCNVTDRFISIDADNAEKSLKHLKTLGIQLTDDSAFIITATLKELLDSDIISHTSVQNIDSISGLKDEAFLKLQKDSGCRFCIGDRSEIENDVSSYFSSDKGCGLLLVRKASDDMLITSFLGCNTPEVGADILGLIAYSAARAKEIYDPKTSVQVICRTAASKELISKLLPDTKPSAYWYCIE